jgi:hypothetical protein
MILDDKINSRVQAFLGSEHIGVFVTLPNAQEIKYCVLDKSEAGQAQQFVSVLNQHPHIPGATYTMRPVNVGR